MPEHQVKQKLTCCSGESILNSSEYKNKMTDRGGKMTVDDIVKAKCDPLNKP